MNWRTLCLSAMGKRFVDHISGASGGMRNVHGNPQVTRWAQGPFQGGLTHVSGTWASAAKGHASMVASTATSQGLGACAAEERGLRRRCTPHRWERNPRRSVTCATLFTPKAGPSQAGPKSGKQDCMRKRRQTPLQAPLLWPDAKTDAWRGSTRKPICCKIQGAC